MKIFNFKFLIFKEGFTLVELLVSMSIFVVIVAIASGVFIKSIQNENHLITVMGMQGNLNIALEQMAREIRGGYLFNDSSLSSAAKDCATDTVSGNPAGYSSVTFIGPSGTTTYALSSSGRIARSEGGATTTITSSDVNVSNLCFIVSQANLGDSAMYGADAAGIPCNPWRVTIFAEASPNQTSQTIQPFNLQTTVSSRVLPKDMPVNLKTGKYACN